MDYSTTQENYNVGFIRLKEILKLIPVSEAGWWNGCQKGIYPKAYKISSRITAWKKSEIMELLDSFKHV